MTSRARFLRAGEEAEFNKLFANTWGEKHILLRRPDLMRWQFNPNHMPINCDAPLSVLVIEHNDRLEALQGLIGCHVVLGGQRFSAVWLANLHQRSDAVRPGLGMQMMLAPHGLPIDFIGVSGVGPKVDPLYRRMKYHVLEGLPRWIGVLNLDHAVTLCRRVAPIEEFTLKEPEVTAEEQQHCIEVLDRFSSIGSDWNELWGRRWRPHIFSIDRDASYMNWRYNEHPCFKYHFVTSRKEGALDGLAIFRVEIVKGQDACLVRLLEFWAAEGPAESALLRAVTNEARASRAILIDHFTSSCQIAKCFKDFGFRCDANGEDAVFASRFQPFDSNPRLINAMFYANSRSLNSDPLLHFSDFITVKSDGDQDRPN